MLTKLLANAGVMGAFCVIGMLRCLAEEEHEAGRSGYDREKGLKIVLFVGMEFGYFALFNMRLVAYLYVTLQVDCKKRT